MSSDLGRSPISVIRCIDRYTCSAPEPQVGGCIRAPTLASREASVIWQAQPPRTILMIKKWRDDEVLEAAIEIAQWIETMYPHVEIVVYEDAPAAEQASPNGTQATATAGPASGVLDEKELRSVADAADVSSYVSSRTSSKLQGGVRGTSGEALPVSAEEAGMASGSPEAAGAGTQAAGSGSASDNGQGMIALSAAAEGAASPPAGRAAARADDAAEPAASVSRSRGSTDEEGECADSGDGDSVPAEAAWPAKYRRFYGDAASFEGACGSTSTAASSTTAGSRANERVKASEIDLIVAVGGDGTVLHASSLFQCAMPPIIAVAFGSLGFMTGHSLKSLPDVFDKIMGKPGPTQKQATVQLPPLSPEACAPCAGSAPSYQAAATRAAEAAVQGAAASGNGGTGALLPACGYHPTPVSVSLRMRLKVDVYKRPVRCSRGQRSSSTGGGASASARGTDAPECVASFVVLNELLLERGPCPYMATLAAYVDDEPLTTVHADGLIICTQTGSTAYSLSAGGSILSPNTAAIVFTPICPHTLSFRPLLFPDSAVIRLEVPQDARASAWCSFDGRHSMELARGDYVVVQSSPWPLPLICRGTACGDWIRSIKTKLYWNVREHQKGFGSRKRRVGEAVLLEDEDEEAGGGGLDSVQSGSRSLARLRGHSSFLRGSLAGDDSSEGEEVASPRVGARRS